MNLAVAVLLLSAALMHTALACGPNAAITDSIRLVINPDNVDVLNVGGTDGRKPPPLYTLAPSSVDFSDFQGLNGNTNNGLSSGNNGLNNGANGLNNGNNGLSNGNNGLSNGNNGLSNGNNGLNNGATGLRSGNNGLNNGNNGLRNGNNGLSNGNNGLSNGETQVIDADWLRAISQPDPTGDELLLQPQPLTDAPLWRWPNERSIYEVYDGGNSGGGDGGWEDVDWPNTNEQGSIPKFIDTDYLDGDESETKTNTESTGETEYSWERSTETQDEKTSPHIGRHQSLLRAERDRIVSESSALKAKPEVLPVIREPAAVEMKPRSLPISNSPPPPPPSTTTTSSSTSTTTTTTSLTASSTRRAPPPAILLPPELITPGEDHHEYCCYWASKDECDSNKMFMRPMCQHSCGTYNCSADNVNVCAVTVNTNNCPYISPTPSDFDFYSWWSN